MNDQLSEVLYYVKGSWKYKWTALIVAWFVCVICWLFVSAIPNKYTSEATIQVDSSVLDSVVPYRPDVIKLLKAIQQLMYTSENLEKIASLSALDKAITSAKERQLVIENLKSNIKFIGVSEQIFNIQYEANNPQKAQNVLQSVLNKFSELTREGILSDAVKALKFFDAQIKDYEAQLKHAEKAKEEFTRAMLLKGVGGKDGGSVADAKAVSHQLREAKLQLNVALSRKNALQKELNQAMTEGGWDIPTPDQPLPEIDEQIQLLRDKVRELRLKYTDNHPTILSYLKTIATLEKRKKLEFNDPVADLNGAIPKNPYLQSLKTALSEANTQVATSQTMVYELEQLKANIEKELDNGLRGETELKNLNRNYDTIKASYEQLLKNREELVMSMKRDELGAVQFKIKDAPNVPLEASSPNRKLLYSGVFAFGLVLGVMTAFLLYFVRPTIMSTTQIRQLLGLPILGSVSLKLKPGQIEENHQSLVKFGYTFFGLVCIYAGFMAVDILEIKQLSIAYIVQAANL
jgi:polysaccharide chain length determinant protein (PEP-CTERM system associated)